MKKNNKGFSLVELIIVIAIMAVLVGVLAPQFIKYVEQSRRGKDIQNADMIKEAIQSAIADGVLSTTSTDTISSDAIASSLTNGTVTKAPVTTAKITGLSTNFTATWNATTGVVSVTVTDGSSTWDLTTEAGASSYKAK